MRAPPTALADHLYRLLNVYNSATIDRFHMTTQRPLSAATPAPQAQPRLAPRFARRHQWHRFTLSLEGHSCLPRGGAQPTKGLGAVARPRTQPTEPAASLPSKSLIANPELKFHLSLLRINDLKFPNRKFSTILDPCSAPNFSLLATSHSPLATASLIHGSAIKTPRNTFKRNTYEFLIGGKWGSPTSPAAQPQPPNLAPTPRVCYFPSRTPLE
jgi:hypothetical protein